MTELRSRRSRFFSATQTSNASLADGVLVAAGGGVSGYTLFVKDGKPMHEYNYFTVERFEIAGKDGLTPGPARDRLRVQVRRRQGWQGGTGTIFVGGKEQAKGKIDKNAPCGSRRTRRLTRGRTPARW